MIPTCTEQVEMALHTALGELPSGTSNNDIIDAVIQLVGWPVYIEGKRDIDARIAQLR